MASSDTNEFWLELEATDVAFVRRKFAAGGYGPTRERVVANWLHHKEKLDDEKRAQQELRLAKQNAWWVRLAAIGTLLVAIIAIANFIGIRQIG
jgi:hypothetical protein